MGQFCSFPHTYACTHVHITKTVFIDKKSCFHLRVFTIEYTNFLKKHTEVKISKKKMETILK